MKYRTASAFTIHTDLHGRSIVRLDVGGSDPAILLQQDWDRVQRDFGPTWYLSGDGKGRHYVAANRLRGGGLITLARVVADAQRGERVKYRDGNRLNLLPENLEVFAGPSKHPALEPMSAAA